MNDGACSLVGSRVEQAFFSYFFIIVSIVCFFIIFNNSSIVLPPHDVPLGASCFFVAALLRQSEPPAPRLT